MEKIALLQRRWGVFCREDLKVILCVPPKCGSTSIFHSLCKVGLQAPLNLEVYKKTSEYLEELQIHRYVRDIMPDEDQFKNIFNGSNLS